MRQRFSSVVVLITITCVLAKPIIFSPEERRSCPLFQQIGCVSDVLEKACEPDETPDFVEKTGLESIWMCCCPMPYMKCAKSDRHAGCDAALKKHIEPLTKDSDGTFIRKAVQRVRGDLLKEHENCGKFFAPQEPMFSNGKGPQSTRSIERADIFCETVTWQWEELGDGNEQELETNKCPIPKRPRGDGNARKGQSLSHDEL